MMGRSIVSTSSIKIWKLVLILHKYFLSFHLFFFAMAFLVFPRFKFSVTNRNIFSSFYINMYVNIFAEMQHIFRNECIIFLQWDKKLRIGFLNLTKLQLLYLENYLNTCFSLLQSCIFIASYKVFLQMFYFSSFCNALK